MIFPKNLRIVFKTISALVAGIFFWEQLAFAGDLINAALEQQYKDQSQTFAPSYLQSQQSAAESIISQKQAIENTINTQNLLNSTNTQPPTEETLDLKGPRGGSDSGETASNVVMQTLSEGGATQNGAVLSVTTQAGDVIHYKDGQIDSIEKSDGTILQNLTLDENNNLLGAEIIHPDGTTQIIANGKTSQVIKPDGTIFNYNDDELISTIVYPDGRTATCSYVKDGQNNIIETIVADSEKTSRYDSNGRLSKVEFISGKTIEYDNGVLSKAIDTDGTTYLYETTEVTEGDITEYVAKLKTIISVSGVKYHIEDNNINSIELTDKSLSNFNLDGSGKIINGQIDYLNNTSILIENYKIKELTDASGIKTTYQYSPDGLTCDVVIDDHGSINIYRYIKDASTGAFTIEEGNNTYEYNSMWQLERVENDLGIFEYSYDAGGDYLSASFTSPDGTIRQYDADLDLTETTLPDGTIYTYYDSGDFAGKPKEAILPNGKIVYFDYSITPEGNLKVYKRTSYASNNLYQGSYSNTNIDYSLNPTLKASFKLDSSKTYSSVYAYAYYYGYNNKSVSLSLSVYGQNPSIYYYCYDYTTRQYVYDSKTLDMTINADTDYTMEYVWTGSAVNIYVYESSQSRPADPVYTVTNYQWNPSFSVGGSNANIVLDPSSSGTFTTYKDISTDYNDPLKGDPVHTTSFRFDSTASYKSLYYGVYGYSDSSSDSVYLYYYNNTPELWVYHYDYNTYDYTYNSIPLNITFNDNTTYIIQTKLEDNTLKVYLYEDGTVPGDPIYTVDNVTWNPEIYADINGGDLDVEARDRLETYEYNSADGKLLKYARRADNELLTYIYDEAGVLLRKELVLEDGTTKVYDSQNRLLSETKPNGETTLYEYDEAGNVISITPQFPEGAICVYYDSGAFEGKLKSATLPDGKTVYYDYEITPEGNLKVYKRLSYDDNSLYQYFYTNSNINASSNPTLKTSFKLDSDKYYPSIYANAYYYNYNDKYVSLSLNIYSQKPYIYYYTYNYVTRQYTNDSRELGITINEDTEYTVEYVWTQNSVNVYLYETSQARPDTAVYTISNSNWNPRFSVGGNNANITLDPSSSGTYTTSKSISTDYSNPLKGSPIHTSTFSFEPGASNKSMYYSIYGNTSTSSDSIYLNYYNNTATLYVYHYDYKTYDYTYNTIPLSITFADDTEYTIQTKIENNTLKLYIYETGTTPSNPVYTVDNVTWDPQIYASIYGGDMTVDARDRLETYEYNTTTGIILDKDVEAIMRNKNIIIDDPYKTIPEYALGSSAPLVFPDGKTDIISGAIPDIDFSVELPGTLFDLDGNLVTSSDFSGLPYFDIITYDQNRVIKEVSNPAGDVIGYSDGLVDSILSGSSQTAYSYTLSALNNIEEIVVDRDGIKRIYDQYGNLRSISLDDATQIVYENGQVKEIVKADGTRIKNMTFTDTGDLDNALISYPDGSVAVYQDATLLQIINQSGDTIDYGDGKIRQITLEDGTVYDWSYDVSGNIIILDNSQQERRTYSQGKLIKVEQLTGSKLITNYYYDGVSNDLIRTEVCQTGEILYTYTYTYEDDLTLIHDEDGNTQAYTDEKRLSYIIDSTGKKYSYTYIGQNEGYVEVSYPSGTKVKYDMNGNILEIKEPNGMIIKEITLQNNIPINFTYIKDNTTYKVVSGKISEIISENGTDTLYYDNGFIKSIQEQIGNSLEEYQYYINDVKSYKDASFFQSGIPNNVSYYLDNGTTTLRLSSGNLEFGTGSDGIKHVTVNEVLAAGTYNFTSLTIDEGKTLRISTGTVIKVLGTLTVNGAIIGTGTSDISAYTITVANTGAISTNSHIKANTLNNFGSMKYDVIDTLSHDYSGSSYVNCGNGAATIDGNASTFYGNQLGPTNTGNGTNNWTHTYLYSTHTGAATNYSSFYWKIYAYPGITSGSSGSEAASHVYLQVQQNGIWNTVISYSQGGNGTIDKDETIISSQSNVTGVRVLIDNQYWINNDPTSGSDATLIGKIFELKAFATPTCEYINSSGNVPPSAITQVEYPLSGTFESNVIELNALELDKISWNQVTPPGTQITFQTRVGNTATPDGTWSAWSDPMTDPNGSQTPSSNSKYIQYKITMTTLDSSVTPFINLSDSSLFTLAYKRAPIDSNELSSISYITVNRDGITYAYNNDGLLIWTKDTAGVVTPYDPPDTTNTIELAGLIFDSTIVPSIKNTIPIYVLNDTQKEIYLRENVIESELTAVTGPDGAIAEYNNGQLIKITEADGTVITNITFDPYNNVKDFTYTKDNTIYIVKDGVISEVITSTGNDIRYYTCGAIQSVENSLGIIKSYIYNMPASVSYTTQSVFQNGLLNNTNYFTEENISYLELKKSVSDLGDGTDGDLRVEAGQTVIVDSTKNYKSVYVAAGGKLTVAPWNGSTGGEVQIKCQGSVIIEGTIETNAKGYRGGSGGTVYSGGGFIVGFDSNTGEGPGGGGGAYLRIHLPNPYDGQPYYVIANIPAGGGGYGTAGESSVPSGPDGHGAGGPAYGDIYLTNFYMGSGGGAGPITTEGVPVGIGGNGGGRIKITGQEINISGTVSANGGDGSGAGGGSGGSIWLIGENVNISGLVEARGGQGTDGSPLSAGDGGYGRIRIDSGNVTGNIPSQAYIQQLPYASSGTFQSEVIELDAHQLGNISWNEELPAGTEVVLQTRTGDTPTPDGSWSNWSVSVTDNNGSQITSPAGKYIQYQVILSTQNTSSSPRFVLTDNNGLNISFVRSPLTPEEFDNITSLSVTQDGTTLTYDENGVNINNPQDVIDISSLVFDSTYLDTLKDDIPTYKLGDAQKVITIYNQGNNTPVEIVNADQTVTHFENGYPTQIIDKNGILQVQYTYDADNNVISVNLADARQKLQSGYDEAVAQIVTQKDEALAKLVIVEANSRANIDAQAADIQDQIDKERQKLTQQKALYDPNIYDLSAFDRAFAQLDDYETRLQQQVQDAYLDLANQIADAQARINADAATAMQSLINNEYNKVLGDIVQKESAPIIYQYYRKVLGRDPSDSELQYWMDAAKTTLSPITVAQITQYLQNLPEYADRQTRKQNIINSITTFLNQYLSASDTDRQSMLSLLGLTSNDVVVITQDDINSIASWLNGQSIHFGDSAFNTVITMLQSAGINKSFEDIGRDAIKIDILTGIITKSSTGDLVISMYAMRKVAAINGLALYSGKINYDDLKDQVSRNNVIIHIDGKHYVLVTSVDDVKGTVTYIDTTVGQNGQSITISRNELMNTWKGYSLSKELPADPAKEINATKEKNIRGSSWWSDFWKGIVNFFQNIIAPIAAILLFIPPLAPLAAIALGINIIVQTVSFVVHTGTLMDVVWSVINTVGAALSATILPNIYNAVGNIFSQISNIIPASISGAFQNVMPIFNAITDAVRNIATGIGSIFNATIADSLMNALTTRVISTGIELGTDFLFKSLDLDPTLSHIGSALLAGAIIGMVTPNTNIVAEALRSGTIAGIEELGESVDLDPNITHLSAMMAGSLVGGALDIDGRHLTYEQLMNDIALQVRDEVLRIGISRIGNLVGIDPRISYVVGAGIRLGIDIGYGTDGIFDWDDAWDGIIAGLTTPKTLSVAFSIAGDAIGLDPLYNNIIINLVAGAIEGGMENPQNVIYGIFKGMLDNFIQTTVRAFSFGLYDPIEGGWNRNYQSQYWMGHLISFLDAIQQEGGIEQALMRYMSTIFRDDAIRSINEVGGIGDFLTGRAEIVYEDGVAKKKVHFNDNYKLYLDPNTDEIIGRDYDGIQERGNYGINTWTGGFGLINGTIQKNTENGGIIYYIRGSMIIDKIDIFGSGGRYSIVAQNPEIGLELDDNGMPIGGIIKDFENTQMFEYEYVNNAMTMRLNIQNPAISGSNISMNFSNISDAEKREIIDYYLLANGINNMNPYGSPGYMDGFATDLAHADPNTEDFTFIPLFNEFYGKISPATFEKIYQNQIYAIAIYEDLRNHGYVDQEGKILPSFLEVKNPADFIMSSQFSAIKNDIYQILWSSCNHLTEDVAKWLEDVHGDSEEITNKIINDIQTKFGGNYPEDMVGFCYSGAGDPFIQAINKQAFNGQYLDVNSIVLVGTPLKKDIIGVGLWNNRTIINPNVKTVISIEGERDIFHPTDHNFDSSLFVQDEFKIVIKDAGHTDYFYDPNKPTANDVFKMKVSRFIAEVTARSKDSEQLRDFLRRPGISIVNGKYVVDTNEVTYDQ